MLNVDPTTVDPGEIFTVTNPDGPIPTKIECVIEDGGGSRLQTNVFGLFGSVLLHLKDKFGALQVESCDDRTCIDVVRYDVTLSNIGPDDIDITAVNFDLNGEVEDLLPRVQPNPLAPSQSSSIEVKRNVDICLTVEYCAEVTVDADSPSTTMCQDDENYKFAPSTHVDVDIVCTLPDGSPCNEVG